MADKLKYKRVLGDWVLGKTLGQGSMGKVKLAFNTKSKEKFACKIIHRPADAPDLPKGVTLIGPTADLKDLIVSGIQKKAVKSKKDAFDNSRLLREVGVSLLLDHENIVKLKFIYMDAENYYLFFQYVDGGQLLDFIISHGVLNEKLARKFLRQILAAVDYCHSYSIVHRDLKIENILLDKKGKLKLIDFGLANFSNPFKYLATFCGSLYFAAPEVLAAKKYIGPEVDMWSIGVILYVLVSGRVPFDDSSLPALHRKIKAGIYDSPRGVSPDCLDLISRLLEVDPRKRASMEDVKKHPWVLKNSGELLGANSILYPPVKLPINAKVVKTMIGLGFGSESEIIKSLEMYLNDNRSQGMQKWSIGGRSINCPESPLISVYKLTLIKLGKLQPLPSEKGSGSHRVLRQISQTVGAKDFSRWNLFGKTHRDPDETINMEDSLKSDDKENQKRLLKGVKTKGFMSIFNRTKHEEVDNIRDFGIDRTTIEGSEVSRPSVDFSRDFENLGPNSPRGSIDMVRGTMKMPSKSLDLRRDAIHNFDDRKSFFGTLRLGKIRSKTQMDLQKSGGKSAKASRFVSPSLVALKAFSSRIFSKKEENTPTQNIIGAATLDIKTSYLSGIFTIRNTTNLALVEVRKELVKAISRVPNLVMIEQKGYFFCKYYDAAPIKEKESFFQRLSEKDETYAKHEKHASDDSSITIVNQSKPKVQFEVFIRKIPFSSLHGIQFSKISGDAYKVR